MKKHLFFLFITATFSFQSFAQAGKLDLSFGTGGKVTTTMSSASSSIENLLVQLDGKIIAVGYSNLDKYLQISIARYHSNGSLDSSFGTYGKQFTSFDTAYNTAAFSAALQADGKIVVAGVHETYSGEEIPFTIVALARYNNDGSLDNTFGTAGKVTKLFGTLPRLLASGANSVAIQADGKIVIGGFKQPIPYVKDFLLLRYHSNGLIDSSFGTDGVVTTNFGAAFAHAYKVLIQKDGKIIAVGTSNDEVAIARYNNDGSLDNSFDGDGKQTTSEGINSFTATSAVLQKDGKIVVVGDIGYPSKMLAIRYHTNGSLDSSFSTDGIQTVDYGIINPRANAVAVQEDGKILISGQHNNYGTYEFVVVRLRSDGNLDISFDKDGIVTTAFDTNDCSIYTMALQKDNKIIVGGFSNSHFALARYFSGIELGMANFDEDNHQISVYPNPVVDNVMLRYTLINAETISIELRDLQGKLISVLKEEKQQAAGDYTISLDLPSRLASGAYFISLSSARGAIYTKIIK